SGHRDDSVRECCERFTRRITRWPRPRPGRSRGHRATPLCGTQLRKQRRVRYSATRGRIAVPVLESPEGIAILAGTVADRRNASVLLDPCRILLLGAGPAGARQPCSPSMTTLGLTACVRNPRAEAHDHSGSSTRAWLKPPAHPAAAPTPSRSRSSATTCFP